MNLFSRQRKRAKTGVSNALFSQLIIFMQLSFSISPHSLSLFSCTFFLTHFSTSLSFHSSSTAFIPDTSAAKVEGRVLISCRLPINPSVVSGFGVIRWVLAPSAAALHNPNGGGPRCCAWVCFLFASPSKDVACQREIRDLFTADASH